MPWLWAVFCLAVTILPAFTIEQLECAHSLKTGVEVGPVLQCPVHVCSPKCAPLKIPGAVISSPRHLQHSGTIYRDSSPQPVDVPRHHSRGNPASASKP